MQLLRLMHEIKALRQEIKMHDDLYYTRNAPIITDYAYDQLKLKLLKLENELLQFSGGKIAQQESTPSTTVGAALDERFRKISHKRPMLSLDNAFSREDVHAFINRVEKLHGAPPFPLVCEPKIDGISFSAIYTNGDLLYATTRGDGKDGEDITENYKQVRGILINIPYKRNFEIRGEIYMKKEDFLSLNKFEENKNAFANPRNATGGSLRQLDPLITKARKLHYLVWSGFLEEEEINTHYETLQFLKTLGFNVSNLVTVAHSLNEMWAYYTEIEKKRATLEYDTDGVVYKINSLTIQNQLGHTSRAPRHSIAHKFPGQTAITQILDIKLQISRNGILTPVAKLNPVNIGGVLVSRATLHNAQEIGRKDFRVGDTVKIERAGDVIPKIVSVLTKMRLADSTPYVFPTVCPECGSLVVLDGKSNTIRICTGNKQCPPQVLGKILHFISKQGANIAGLAAMQLKDLLAWGYVRCIEDLFILREINNSKEEEARLEKRPRWKDKAVQNLLEAIEKAKIIKLERFIYALGIRHIGVEIAKLIAKFCKTIDNFQNLLQTDLLKTLQQIEGIGETITKEVEIYLKDADNLRFINTIKTQLKILDYEDLSQATSKYISTTAISGKLFVFSGTLDTLTREKAKEYIEEMQGSVSSNISHKVDYIVVGTGPGEKVEKAKKLGIHMLSEAELLQMLKKQTIEAVANQEQDYSKLQK